MLLQLNPPIPCETPKGAAFCIAFIDYGQEHDTLWKCIITSTGEVWDVPQPQVRGVKNVSMGRGRGDPLGYIPPWRPGEAAIPIYDKQGNIISASAP